jgi:hypothetical protein
MTQIARDKVKGPALGLKITAGVGAAFGVLSLVMNLLGIGMGAASGGEDGMANMMGGTIGIVAALLSIGLYVFVWVAAGKMANLTSYNMSLAGAIVAMLPCSLCCLIGLPIGIWTVITLSKAEVKSAFTP